jgi:hypothetical protein
MKNFQDFVSTVQDFLASRGGQIAIAFIVYLSAVGLIEKGPGDDGEKIEFMAIGSILQSMVSPDKKA